MTIIKYILLLLIPFMAKSHDDPIRLGTGISKKEVQYNINRQKFINKALRNFLDIPINTNDAPIPNISVALSGGGLRSGIFSLGLLRGLEEIGLYDGLKYITGISGSAQMLFSLTLENLSLEDFNDQYKDAANQGLQNVYKNNWYFILEKILFRKRSGLEVNLEFINGCILEQDFLKNKENDPLSFCAYNLEQQLMKKNYQFPFPINSSILINISKDNYSPFFNFTPYEAGCDDFNFHLDINVLGNQFTDGLKKTEYPSESIAIFMGIVGSAYTISLNEMKESLSKNPEFVQIIDFIQKEFPQLNNKRLDPPQLHNFMYKLPNKNTKQLFEEKFMKIIDAGTQVDLGIPPLLIKERLPDFLIVGGSAGDSSVIDYPDLRYAQEYAKIYNLPFPNLDNPIELFKDILVFKGVKNKIPTIIYFVNTVYDSTVKLQYSEKEFKQLQKPIFQSVINAKEKLKQLIQEEGF